MSSGTKWLTQSFEILLGQAAMMNPGPMRTSSTSRRFSGISLALCTRQPPGEFIDGAQDHDVVDEDDDGRADPPIALANVRYPVCDGTVLRCRYAIDQ